MDIANQMRVTARFLDQAGHLCHFCDEGQTYLHYEGSEALQVREPNMLEYDIFDIYFASFPHNLKDQLPKSLKRIHHFCGSEVRQFDIATAQNPFAVVKDGNSDKIKERVRRMAEISDACTLRDMELYDHVSEHFKRIFIVPRMLDLSTLDYHPYRGRRKPLIVHAPTDPNVKGTRFIVAAVEKLKRSFDFDFLLVAGMPHEKVTQIMAEADLFIDQLHIGTYGVASIEAMALGTPVVCYLSDYMQQYLPPNPIISATPLNIEEILAHHLSNPASLWGRRQEGRAFVEAHHDAAKVVKQLVEVYEQL